MTGGPAHRAAGADRAAGTLAGADRAVRLTAAEGRSGGSGATSAALAVGADGGGRRGSG
ncbi:hypothetical protein ABG088_04905 [Hydrogenibacillus schlegelii]|uniref:hypothetical protein n=1 Tax=Hydrogenibacillus schlegelii TaxID=1484 RepID=UPI001470EC5B|nr:hypothetical protein [Hydrogenibacillus schlegelii]